MRELERCGVERTGHRHPGAGQRGAVGTEQRQDLGQLWVRPPVHEAPDVVGAVRSWRSREPAGEGGERVGGQDRLDAAAVPVFLRKLGKQRTERVDLLRRPRVVACARVVDEDIEQLLARARWSGRDAEQRLPRDASS